MVRKEKHPEVVYTSLEDGAVLLHLESKFYYSLNESGEAIWRLLDSAESLEDLVQEVMLEYEVEQGRVKGSISKFLEELEREQLVVPHQGGTGGYPDEKHAMAEIPSDKKKPYVEPELLKHDEPLHEVVQNPFDPNLPLAE